ncbi:hypothetical protein HCN44_009428 [Aphidius gifuensis]|uniref:Uncharacterized protein n=1 Tax=Aphidius gifuensis TaxID=684658 RepID=A0A835CYV6_APHGI|nr:ras guanine nucleotide exchange factor E [Aphidius gifuensis]KAF7998030.1 hypothetical protein HCN44_009428 [Aphidius gifuensis]
MFNYNKFVLLQISLLVITSVGGVENQEKSDPIINSTKELLLNNPNKKITVAEGIQLSPQDLPKSNLKNVVKKIETKLSSPEEIPSNSTVEYTTKSSVVARKGVDQLPIDSSININNKNLTKIILNTSKNKTDETATTTDKTSITTTPTTTTSTTTIKTTTKKPFKPKPTATGDDDVEVDAKPFPSMPTKTPPIGMPSKISYVIPVVLTILVGTLFIVFVLFLYRNGREYWEKRHYRRMDFLIDGMYNE